MYTSKITLDQIQFLSHHNALDWKALVSVALPKCRNARATAPTLISHCRYLELTGNYIVGSRNYWIAVEVDAAYRLFKLNQDAELEAAVKNQPPFPDIELVRGPRGGQGEQGIQGEKGDAGQPDEFLRWLTVAHFITTVALVAMVGVRVFS